VKKPTSKSASESQTASSPSGTSKKTVVTESKIESKFQFILDLIQKQTPEETRQSLVRAGIITESGELTSHYKPRPKTKKKKAKE